MNESGDAYQREAVRRLLVAFGGDAEAARLAVQAYNGPLHLVGASRPVPPAVESVISGETINNEPLIEKTFVPVTPTGPILLSARDLTRDYKLGKQTLRVLDAVNFDIHEGEIIAITGASGSGKSTLLHLLGGLDKPSSGEVLIGETSLAKLSDAKLSVFRRQTIGYVFQFFYLQPFLNLKRNLEVPGMFAGLKRKNRAARSDELAEKVGLADRLKHYPKELSGGQMQRAAIARALLNNPRILLADEPTGNLDSQNGQQIIELFESIRKEFGTTIVIITHDPAIAARADRIIKLQDGKVVA